MCSEDFSKDDYGKALGSCKPKAFIQKMQTEVSLCQVETMKPVYVSVEEFSVH